MWRCKKCGNIITGLGYATFETWGFLNKKGKIKKHKIIEKVEAQTNVYHCDSCMEDSESLEKIAYWEEEE